MVTETPATPTGALHIAWTAFQRRQVSMAPETGFECVFMPIPARGRAGKAFAYIKSVFRTVALLRKRRPRTVWVQLPQVPLLWASLIYRGFFRGDARVVADCHNAMFRPPWSRFPLGLRLLARCDCVLVHNDMVRTQALELGVPDLKLIVLEDVPPAMTSAQDVALPACLARHERPWALFPGSFAADEPIEEVMAAARLAPDITFVITGRTENAARNGHDLGNTPCNAVMPGFVPVTEFDRMLHHADVVMGLTRVEGVQLSVCNEALGFGKPLIVSNTSILTRLFGAASRSVDSANPEQIVAGVRDVLADADEYSRRAVTFSKARRRAWISGPLDAVTRRLA